MGHAAGATVLLTILSVWLLAHPEARLDDSGIRILWELTKCSFAGLVLLTGCVMVFRKRAGIVLLHSRRRLDDARPAVHERRRRRIANDDSRRAAPPAIPTTSATSN